MNLTTGEHTFIGSIEFADGPEFWIEHMAIGPDGVGYGVTNYSDASPPQLVSIDLATARATLIGEFGVDRANSDWWSLAYNPADDEFYATSQSTR